MCTDQDRRGLRVGHGDWYRPASPELPATACSGPTLQEMATAIDTALASGRLDERQLLARAARVRRLTRPLPAPPEDLPGFVAEPDQIGLGAARHIFDSTGLIRVEGSITLVDLRIRTGHAGGLASHGYAEALVSAASLELPPSGLSRVRRGLRPGSARDRCRPGCRGSIPARDHADGVGPAAARRPGPGGGTSSLAADFSRDCDDPYRGRGGSPDAPRPVRAPESVSPNAQRGIELLAGDQMVSQTGRSGAD